MTCKCQNARTTELPAAIEAVNEAVEVLEEPSDEQEL